MNASEPHKYGVQQDRVVSVPARLVVDEPPRQGNEAEDQYQVAGVPGRAAIG